MVKMKFILFRKNYESLNVSNVNLSPQYGLRDNAGLPFFFKFWRGFFYE